jgi:hypothetical protein
MSATELTNTDVDFVALVKRGANRLPFRITKGDDEMIDLHAIGRKMFKKADAAPSVIAVIARKEDAASPMLRAVANACGLDLTKLTKSEDDALVTLVKKDAPTQGAVVVKLDRDVGVTVTGSNLRKGFENFDFAGTPFADVNGAQGFCVGPTVAAELHKAELDAILVSATLPSELQTRLQKSNDAFNAYVGVLTAYLPAVAVKADQLLKIGTGNATGGAGTDQETGDGLGDRANGKAEKADAGKNGTGAGAELGEGTGTNDRATADDAENTEVNAKPGERVSGDSSGLPAKLKAPTQKDGSEQMDDDGANGARSDIPAKAKAPTTKADLVMAAVNALVKALTTDVTTEEITGESPAGEGAAQSPSESDSATARATSDDASNAGGNGVTGKPKGKTLDMNGVPAKLQAPTQKNDGDADIGKKGQGNELEDQTSGAGAQRKDVQALKGEDPLMRMIQALAKSVQDSNAAVTKSVEALAQRVEGVTALAKKTDAALNGTVFNEDGGDHAPRRAVKSDGDGGIPLLDTGLSRRRA